ncbi:hypothetical protein EC988_002504 [Linderina pennispora]|nr:hypothetical protein EC988_002504 [Linderina pennispora]
MDRGQASQLTKLVAASLVSLDLHNLHPSIGLSRLFTMTGTRERVKFQNLKDLRLHFRWISSHQAINCGDGFCAPLFPNLQTLVLDPSEYEFTNFLLLFAPAPTFRLEISYSERSMQFDIMPFASLRQLNVALRSGYSDRYPYNPAEFLNWILSSNPHLTSLEVSFAHMYVVSVPGRIRCKRLRRLKIGRASFPVDQILEILSKLTELQVLCICVHDSTTGPNKSQCLVPLDTMLQSLEVTAVRAAACAGITRIANRIPSLVKLVMDI